MQVRLVEQTAPARVFGWKAAQCSIGKFTSFPTCTSSFSPALELRALEFLGKVTPIVY
jgi:hypothetical protein